MNIVQRIAASVALLALDGAWLYWVMGPMYTRLVPRIQGRPLRSNIVYAVAAYAFMLIGLHLFVLPGDDETPSSASGKNSSVTRGGRVTWGGVARAFAFGAVVYGVVPRHVRGGVCRLGCSDQCHRHVVGWPGVCVSVQCCPRGPSRTTLTSGDRSRGMRLAWLGFSVIFVQSVDFCSRAMVSNK